jgi:hypothetical protein
MRSTTSAFVAFAAMALLGCGGGSGGESPVVDGGGSTTVLADFVPDEPAPPASTVSLQKGATSGNLVTVGVDVTGVSNIYGAALDLTYDGTLAEYVGFAPGVFLENGESVVVNYQVESPTAGRVVVGASRTGNVPGVSTASTKRLVQLTFRVKKLGTGALTPGDGVLYDAQNPPQAVGGLTWEGGTLHGK